MSLADAHRPAGWPACLADSVSVGLFTCRQGRITWANDALADMVGARAGSELLGLAPADLVTDAGRGTPDWHGWELNRSVGVPVECELARPHGQTRRVRVRPLGQGAFEVARLLDEPALPESPLPTPDPAEVDSLRREVARLRRERAQAGRARAELFAGVSHELKTPLVVLSGFMRLLLSERAGDLTSEQRRYLRQAERSGERLSKLVDDLLSLHPGGVAKEGAIDPRPGSLSELLGEIAADFEALALSQGRPLAVELCPDPSGLRFDAMALTRVVTNLLANAFAHGEGAPVGLRSHLCGEAIEIHVEDEGPGIPEDEHDRIFEPYVRGRGARPGSGIGLGLAICRRIVSRHGGQLVLRGRAQGGCRFVIRLPLSTSAVEDRAARSEVTP